jgi:hypothetical protein
MRWAYGEGIAKYQQQVDKPSKKGFLAAFYINKGNAIWIKTRIKYYR